MEEGKYYLLEKWVWVIIKTEGLLAGDLIKCDIENLFFFFFPCSATAKTRLLVSLFFFNPYSKSQN